MSVTIKDVAKLANVSPSTVSRVIADNPRISNDTKVRVFKAMKELNYKPNAIARSLANKKTNTLGLIIPNSDEDLFKNPFFINVMRGISLYAQKRGFHIMYTYSTKEEEELSFLEEFIESNLVDGIILLTAVENDPCIKYLKDHDFPFAVIGRPDSSEGVLWVDNDNFQAMYNVVNLLINKGHKDIAFIGGPNVFNFSKDRLEGYKRAMSVRGNEVTKEMIVYAEGFDLKKGYDACKTLFRHYQPTAIVTTDDLLAYGVLNCLSEQDSLEIKVTGFNNIAFSELQRPSITSVDINADLLGYYAAKLLISELKEEPLSINHHLVETKIIERESSE